MADDRKSVVVEPWQVLDTRYSYRDRWLALRSDTVRVPNGTILSPYHTIEFPEWICAVALTPDHHIVLIEEYRHGVGRLSIELPCGTPDHDGEDLLAAMQRELLEETGYAADEWHALGSSTAPFLPRLTEEVPPKGGEGGPQTRFVGFRRRNQKHLECGFPPPPRVTGHLPR
jgi:8-oxo-dGTP pyrophosphatase MutT (NUDIX family)